MRKADKVFARKLNNRFAKKQNELSRQPGVMGDGNSNLAPSGLNGFIYCVVGDKIATLPCNRVQPEYGRRVWVGFAPEQPTIFQVLSYLTDSVSGSTQFPVGFAPAKRYEWGAVGGGQDPLHVHLRAFSPLKLGMSTACGMNVDLYRGKVVVGGKHINIPRQNINLSAHIPTIANKCAKVMISIDDTGAIIQTKGEEVDINILAPSHRPAIPANTIFVCGCIRVYYGQTKIQEGRDNSDFDDLRFPGIGVSVSGSNSSVVRMQRTAPSPTFRGMLWYDTTGDNPFGAVLSTPDNSMYLGVV